MNPADIAWLLMASCLVMLMTPAVGLFYGGLVRKKNVLSTIMMSFAALVVLTLQWYAVGYSLAFGPDINGVIGSLAWFGLNSVTTQPSATYASNVPQLLFMLFQMKFAIITPALIIGAMVERVKFTSFMIFIVLWSTFVYDPLAHWIWGNGGWLSNLGALDFAGGTVIHISSGIAALAVALAIRKRDGFGSTEYSMNNIGMTVLGAILLWFGWFGFNGGSALGATELAVHAIVTTNLAAAAAALTWMLLGWTRQRPSVTGVATGAVVGLVAITPACGFVDMFSSIIIGMVGSLVSYFAINLMHKLKVDDSLDVFACHGLAGTWGAIATGLFAQTAVNPDGANGLLFGGLELFNAQLISVGVAWVWSFGMTWLIVKAIDLVRGFTVSVITEEVGLDLSQHGEEAQPVC